MNILVINLTRFGDLLQTQPLIHTLKAQGHKVGLACLANFAPATELLNGLDHVAVLPGAALLAELDADWRNALLHIQHYVTELQSHFPVEGIVNTTATLSARLLCRRLTTADTPVWGFALDEDGFGCNGNTWATFLQGSTMRRLNCPFNIVDMFRMTANCGHVPAVNRLRKPSAEVRQDTGLFLQQHTDSIRSSHEIRGYVSFQLGASEARRQWPVEAFAQLGDRLWEELQLCPVLLGAPAEKALAGSYAATTHSPFVDAVGATDIPHLAGLLTASRMLVTNDTGTMHLAAGLDVPVLALFLATAQAWDTGPYRADCCCLEPALSCHPCAFDSRCPHDNMCLQAIPPQQVGDLVCHYLATGQWVNARFSLPTPLTGEGARVWLTTTDAYGFAHLQCVSGHGGEDRSLWLAMQRHFYRQIIDGMDGAEVQGICLPRVQGELSAPFRESVHTALRQAEDLLHLLREQGLMVQQVAGPLPKQRFLASCNRVRTLFEQSVPLCALGYVWTVVLQERGEDLGAILHMARILQQSLGQWRQYLEH